MGGALGGGRDPTAECEAASPKAAGDGRCTPDEQRQDQSKGVSNTQRSGGA